MILTQKTMGIPNWVLLAWVIGGVWWYNKDDTKQSIRV